MPQHVQYTAKRSLISGHTAGDLITMDVVLSQKDRGRETRRNVQTSLSGKAYITYHSGSTEWSCATPPLNKASADAMREFLDSTEDQIFAFDPDNAASDSPNNRRAVIRDGDYSESRRAAGAGQDDHYFSFAWRMTEV